jgi:ABC-type amino acid transport substrate-binding protein/mono/diheme cytochrome c family protein
MMSTLNPARSRRAWPFAAAGLAGLLISSATVFAAEAPLKVCADPDNLPFSSSAGQPKGFYIDLADRLAEALGRTPEQVWQPAYLGKRAVRGTLLARKCDLYIGLPADGGFMAPQVMMSAPFAAFNYALVLAPGPGVPRLADLQGKRVAVQFASPPQNLLATMDGIQSVTVLSPEEGMRALAEGRADAAYLWGPSAGYLNKSLYAGRYRVVPTDGPAMSWNVAIGFRRADNALRERVQRELDTLGPWLEETEAQYGFPIGTAMQLTRASDAPVLVAAAGPVDGLFALADVPAVKAPPGNEAQVLKGRELFNASCAHCHGTDAASPEKRIDLRRLNKRYGDKVDDVFSVTMQNGRPDKGMPIWKGVITDTEIGSIKAFVDSVQQAN